MQITRIRTDRIMPDEKRCGEFTVYFDDILAIHKIYVIKGEKGLFIAFPNTGEMKLYKNQQDKKRYDDIAHPTQQSFRKSIEDMIIKQYNDELVKMKQEG